MTSPLNNEPPIALSIGIMAWNEEASIGPMLSLLLKQSVYERLAARGESCEIICLANGCTDGTVNAAEVEFARAALEREGLPGPRTRVADIPQAGRNNAWNLFVHQLSARETRYICLMDADIILNRPDTLELVLGELERNPRLGGASDTPVKNIAGGRPSLREKLSLAASDMTGTIEGRLNGMLYCLRAAIARNIYLPRDLGATDDGFFKAAICTDFFRAPTDPSRVVSLGAATHLYEPYLSLRDVLGNQKRQMIGQTTVFVLETYLRTLPEEDRGRLGETLHRNEARDPDWFRRMIDAHVAARPFWGLFPGVLSFRWKRLGRMRGGRRLAHVAATALGTLITLAACWQASRFLRRGRGATAFWPKTERAAILPGTYAATK